MNIAAQSDIARLQQGEKVVRQEPGNSMTPILKSREPTLVAPCDPASLKRGDIVFCKVRKMYCQHLVTAIKGAGDSLMLQISNNHGHVNGWIRTNKVYGKVIDHGYHLIDSKK